MFSPIMIKMHSILIILAIGIVYIAAANSNVNAEDSRAKRQIGAGSAATCKWLKEHTKWLKEPWGCDDPMSKCIFRVLNGCAGCTCNDFCKKIGKEGGSCVTNSSYDSSTWCSSGQTCVCSKQSDLVNLSANATQVDIWQKSKSVCERLEIMLGWGCDDLRASCSIFLWATCKNLEGCNCDIFCSWFGKKGDRCESKALGLLGCPWLPSLMNGINPFDEKFQTCTCNGDIGLYG